MTENPLPNGTPRTPQDSPRRWTWRVLLAAILLSLIFGGIAGGLLGGGATYLVLSRQKSPAAQQPPSVPEPASLPKPPSYSPPEGALPVAAVAERVGPAVVTVVNKLKAQENPLGVPGEPPQASGSGVILDPRGYIVTNHHVVENAQELTVIFADGTRKPAKLIAHDYPFSDLAVIQVEGSDYPYAVLGDSDKLQVGEPVVAIGSALGDFRNTVTTGVVSGLGRSLPVAEDLVMEGMIQTDAAINHGNSGGPLVNLLGQVVGINTAIVRGGQSGDVAEGLGFSIPSNTVRYVVEQITAKGKVSRPYLGIRSMPVNRSMAAYYNLPVDHGVYVTEVSANTPAAQAGIQKDDIIVRIGQDTVDEEHPLINVLSRYETGQQVTVELNRQGKTVQVEVVLGERP